MAFGRLNSSRKPRDEGRSDQGFQPAAAAAERPEEEDSQERQYPQQAQIFRVDQIHGNPQGNLAKRVKPATVVRKINPRAGARKSAKRSS